jgi:hypothetical protein
VCARALAELIAVCATRSPSPNDKLVRNVCAMACGDASHTPVVTASDLAGQDTGLFVCVRVCVRVCV